MPGLDKLKVGVIGVGMGRAHISGYKPLDNAEVVAIADINEDRANKAAKEFGIAKIFTDYRSLLELQELHAVNVCTPNHLHVPMAVDALEAGKHVLCEKPLSTSAGEAAKAVEAARRCGKNLMMCFNNRYRKDTQFLKQYIESGGLGEIYFAKTGWVRRRGIPGLGGWFTTKAKSGGGPLIDLGVHVIDLAIWLMGNPQPVAVSGATYTKFGDQAAQALGGTYDVEDLAAGFLRFDNGASLLFEASWASNVKREGIYTEILGTKAGAALSPLEIFTEQYGAQVDIDPGLKPSGGHAEAIAHFVDCILNGKQPLSPGEDGLQMMKVLDAIYESAEKGEEVAIR